MRKYQLFALTTQARGTKNPGRQVTVATKFCSVTTNMCGYSVHNVLNVTHLTPRILMWLLDF
jgi:hypothetical protein